MKRRGALWLLWLALLAGGLASGMAIAASGSAATTVIVKKALNKKLSKAILVTGSGLTLYENTRERSGKIHCVGQCRLFWPPLLVPAGGKPTAGAGVSQAKLGTIRRLDGGRQVTYKGVPLYRFKSDKKAGDVTGQGVKDLGGTWGPVVLTGSTTAPPPPPTTTYTTTTTTTTTTTNTNPYP
jgi:predicted lipoprotein with Yx(FWY)xxD motif